MNPRGTAIYELDLKGPESGTEESGGSRGPDRHREEQIGTPRTARPTDPAGADSRVKCKEPGDGCPAAQGKEAHNRGPGLPTDQPQPSNPSYLLEPPPSDKSLLVLTPILGFPSEGQKCPSLWEGA